MYTPTDKQQKNKSQPAANTTIQKKGAEGSALQMKDERPEAIQMRQMQAFANDSPQVRQLRTLQVMTNRSSSPVAQLKKEVVIISFSGKKKIDLDDEEVLTNLVDVIKDEDEGLPIIKEILSSKALSEAIEERRPGLLAGLQPKEAEDPGLAIAKAKAERDTGGWIVPEARSLDEALAFLSKVLEIARSIIPQAFNRNSEVGGDSNTQDYTNTAYASKDAMVHAYSHDLQRNGITVMNNYIHPAALERMYQIIKETAPDEDAMQAPITGICKDFASICYGLILQNDVSKNYKPKLAFMHNHVYVEVTVATKQFAVDAWLNGRIMPKELHEQEVMKAYHGVSKATSSDLFTGRDHQQSLKNTYQQAELARLVWYQNEATYREIARKEWARGKTKNTNRGSF